MVGIIQSIRKKQTYSEWDRILIKYGSLRRFAKHNKIPYLATDNLNSQDIINRVKKKKCNLICVASAGQLLKGDIFNVPKFGILNAHSSILPNYRGADPSFWVFRNQEKIGGITIHYIDDKMDNGDILLQRKFNIPVEMSYTEYNNTIANVAGEAYVQVLDDIINGTLVSTKQTEKGNMVARRVSKDDYNLNFSSWSVQETYHFLYGTDGINQIYHHPLFKYKIVKNNIEQKTLYRIECKDGYIAVNRVFIGPKEMLKRFLAFCFAKIPIKKIELN